MDKFYLMGGAMVGDNALVAIDHSHIIPRAAMGMPALRTHIMDPAPHHLQQWLH